MGTLRRRLPASFRRWVEAQDASTLLVATRPLPWAATTSLALVLVALAGLTPGLRGFFGLPPGRALACVVPVALVAAAFASLPHGRAWAERSRPLLLLVGLGSVHFLAASLVALGSPRAAPVFASIYLLVAADHGHRYRATLREPFVPLATLVATALAALLADAAQLRLLAIVGAAAVAGGLVGGTFARWMDRVRAETVRLRAAVQAQILGEREHDPARLSQTVVELLGTNHDVNNRVMSLRLEVETLHALVDGRRPPGAGELRDASSRMLEDLGRIEAMLAQARGRGRDAVPLPSEPVEPAGVLESVCRGMRARFPETALVVRADASRAPRVRVAGGAATLETVVENLLRNACEGDGERRARTVELMARRDASGGALELAIVDDGPGFPASQLRGPIAGFVTTKEHGTGLGLYTCERLVRASGGRLERTNRSQGGAVVTIALPVEDA